MASPLLNTNVPALVKNKKICVSTSTNGRWSNATSSAALGRATAEARPERRNQTVGGTFRSYCTTPAPKNSRTGSVWAMMVTAAATP